MAAGSIAADAVSRNSCSCAAEGQTGDMIGCWLVAAQFVTWLVLVIPGQFAGPPAAAMGMMAAGGVGFLWCLTANRPGNFNVAPHVKGGARLVTTGPYRFVRHPIYACALGFFAGFVVWWPGWLKLGAWVALALIVVAKARLEEAALRARFPEYEAYRRGRRFLIPGLW